jgi:hypothetical protein
METQLYYPPTDFTTAKYIEEWFVFDKEGGTHLPHFWVKSNKGA